MLKFSETNLFTFVTEPINIYIYTITDVLQLIVKTIRYVQI